VTLLGGAVVVSCANGEVVSPPQDPSIVRAPTAIVLTGVRVIPMTGAQRFDNQTVIISGGRIVSIEPAGSTAYPAGAIQIQGRGRVLVPALIDMHVHLKRGDLTAYLRAGITTVRNMWGHAAVAALKREIESGSLEGPSIHSASNGLDGSPPLWPFTGLINDAREADSAVQRVVAEGWSAVKVYQQLQADVYDSIMFAAQRRAIAVDGHVPTAVTVQRALQLRQRSIEHLSGYDRAVSRRSGTGTFAWAEIDDSKFPELVRQTVEAGTWNCPTMAIFLQLAQQHPAVERATIITNRRRLVAELVRQGARLLAGTDAGIDVVSPGVSMHDELRELVAAGLSPYQALRAATADAGVFLGVPHLGTIVAGAPAELMLLDGDPLSNIANTARLAGIIRRGTWMSASALDSLGSQP
jgi:imidazolonepropionase-like amidohydrolase